MNVTEFRQLVTPHAPGVPVSLIDVTARQVIVEFFTKTEIWREILDPIMGIQGLSFYEFGQPENAKVIKVLRVSYDISPLKAEDEMSVRQRLASTTVGAPSAYAMTRAAELLIAPAPSIMGKSILAHVVLVPTGAFNTVPDYIIEEHKQAIVDGILSKLLYMPKGWNDQKAAMAHKQLYNAAMAMAHRTNNKEATNRIRVVRYGG